MIRNVLSSEKAVGFSDDDLAVTVGVEVFDESFEVVDKLLEALSSVGLEDI